MLEFENVSKSFWTGETRKVILDGASFRIERGQSLGILARNGTGKTTIVNMMAGLEKPDEGRVRRHCRVSFPLGFMGGINNRHSAAENSRHIARLYGLDPDYIQAFCRWLTDIAEYFDRPVTTYSSGMRTRFTFALMLALEFDLYLIDEGMPSSSDVAFNRRAGSILRDRLSEATVVVVSHQARVLETYCQRAAVLCDGRMQFFDTLEEAKRLYDYSD